MHSLRRPTPVEPQQRAAPLCGPSLTERLARYGASEAVAAQTLSGLVPLLLCVVELLLAEASPGQRFDEE
jgi:hypothetical protein